MSSDLHTGIHTFKNKQKPTLICNLGGVEIILLVLTEFLQAVTTADFVFLVLMLVNLYGLHNVAPNI